MIDGQKEPSKKKYQLRDEGIARKVFSQSPPSMTTWEFMRIAAWKSAYIPASISVGDPDAIEAILQKVLTRLEKYKELNVVVQAHEINWDEWESDVSWMLNDTGLLLIPGVGYSFATGLLSYILPDAFPVMDRLTIGGVFGWSTARCKTSWRKTPVYRKYAEHLAKANLTEWSEFSIHQRDQDLMKVMKPLEKIRATCPFKSLALPALA